MNKEQLFKAQVSIASAYIRAVGLHIESPASVAEYAAKVVKLISETDIENIVLEEADYEI